MFVNVYECTHFYADNLVEAVRVIQGTVPILKSQITKTILNAVSPLFISIDRDMRSCLCDLLETLAQEDSSISNLVMLLFHLSPFLVMRLVEHTLVLFLYYLSILGLNQLIYLFIYLLPFNAGKTCP